MMKGIARAASHASEDHRPSKRGGVRKRVLLGCAAFVVILAAIFLWPLGRATAKPPLSILAGIEPVETREPRFDPNGRQDTFRRHIYRLQMNVDDVMDLARKELRPKKWYIAGGRFLGNFYMQEPAGFLQAQGMHINIRRNIVDPDSTAVLGKPEDSKKWVTITVYEGIRDPNVLSAARRWLLSKARP